MRKKSLTLVVDFDNPYLCQNKYRFGKFWYQNCSKLDQCEQNYGGDRLVGKMGPTYVLVCEIQNHYLKNTKLKYMHSYINNTLPWSFDGLWPMNRDRNVRGATLSNSGDLFVPRARLAFNARLPLHSFPKL